MPAEWGAGGTDGVGLDFRQSDQQVTGETEQSVRITVTMDGKQMWVEERNY